MRYTIAEIKEIVAALAAQYGAERIYLFGSYARGDADKDSDIDLRIDKGPSAVCSLAAWPLTWKMRWESLWI